MAFWVYILRCADGSYYTGHTDNLDKRIGEHHAGAITSCYTFKRRPLALTFSQNFPTRDEALTSEQQIKGWSRKKKEAMMRGDWAEVSRLAKSSNPVHPEPMVRQAHHVRETSSAVRPEPVVQQAHHDRDGDAVRPELVVRQAHHDRNGDAVRPELVVRQAHHDRETSPAVRPEPVEGQEVSIHPSTVRQAHGSGRTEDEGLL